MLTAGELLSDPLVLRAAWRRVRVWYRGADWVPQPDAAAFALTLEERLAEIGAALGSGTYAPSPFRLLAYPKSVASLRHYAVPNTRDQVAFAVFAVLLGPLIDLSIPRHAFGNRWYRALYRNRPVDGKAHWKHRPFALDSAYFYQSYRRDFALFRRCAHWAASAMLGRPGEEEPSASRPVNREDFSEHDLPECCDIQWWGAPQSKGYWGRLDLRLAYPSVRVSKLPAILTTALDRLTAPNVRDALEGFPRHIVDALASGQVRGELANHLGAALASVSYDPGVVGDAWLPPHMEHDLPLGTGHEHPGLPTGLSFSGGLLNAYLIEFDRELEKSLRARPLGQRSAVLRFADDILILGQTPEAVAETLDSVWRALEGDVDAVLAAPKHGPDSTNLRVNWTKVEPAGLRKQVANYLEDMGWARALEPDEETLLEPSAPPGALESFSEWLRRKRIQNWLESDELRLDRIGPFVTHLVERMSAVGGESLDARFGRGAKHRLEELHQLIRLNIADPHVRNDTRLAFAANKIARAFLPEEGERSDVDEIAKIRRSVGEAVLSVPWKFTLWRPVVRAACRRPLSLNPTADERSREESDATDWLSMMIKRLAASGGDDSWIARWPSPDKKPSDQVARLYVSLLRSWFWLAIAEAIRDLRRVTRGHDIASPRHWSPNAWTFRAVDEERAPLVARWLGDLDRWANVLYAEEEPQEYWWEVDALGIAALATVDAASVQDHHEVAIPETVVANPRVRAILASARRVASGASIAASAPVGAWALATFAARPFARDELKELGNALFARGGHRSLRWAQALGLVNFLPPGAGHLAAQLHARASRRGALMVLEDYVVARRVALALHRKRASDESPWTLHRLLWSIGDGADGTLIWPSAAPAVGLPPRVALRMLIETLEAEFERPRQRKVVPPTWVLANGAELWKARHRQLSGGSWQPIKSRAHSMASPGAAWDFEPHAAFFLLHAVSRSRLSPLVVGIWSHLLQFITAAQGDERFLDQIVAAWPAAVPLEERWNLRADISVPLPVWRAIDRLLKTVLSGDPTKALNAARDLIDRARELLATGAEEGDFNWDRVDVTLSLDAGELPMGSIPFNREPDAPAADLALSPHLAQRMTVTMAQVCEEPVWKEYRDAFAGGAPPATPKRVRRKIMSQIAASFASRPTLAPDVEHGPIIFPEVTLPLEEEAAFRRHVLSDHRAAVIGLHWNVLPFAGGWNVNASPPPVRYLVNEALLVVPVTHPRDNAVASPRYFRIRKPLPTHQEHALADSLSASNVLGSLWQILAGNRWYRFVHPTWGDFTIAICSDLLDPSPWKSLQGQILHLFLVSHNQDIQLYESLTWVRAYESHTNVIGTNHGSHGGSFAWTPASGDHKEVAKLRGTGLFLVADITVEVSALAEHQRTGVTDARSEGRAVWEKVPTQQRRWKAPPPGFRERKR